MFGFIEDAVNNVLEIGESLIDGELPSKKQIAKLVSDGVDIATIAATAGVAEDVIEKILED